MLRLSFILKVFFLFLFLQTHYFSFAQLPDQVTAGDPIVLQMPEVSLIDTDHAPINMTLTTSTPGEAISSSVTNSDMWIKISSVVPGNTHRELKAHIAGDVPSGTTLSLIPDAATTTNSAGNLGTPISTAIVLGTIDQNIVTDIGSCYTGTGASDGYRLHFTWALDNPAANYGQIEASTNNTITVYLTLTQSNNNGT